jgi:hypothetical protein
VDPNFYYGGGANVSTMTPMVLAATLLAAVFLWVLPRKYKAVPILLIAFLTPFEQQVLIGGAHMYVGRIIAMVGICRMLVTKRSSKEPLFVGGLSGIDIGFGLCAFATSAAVILRERAGGAVVNQVGGLIDAVGLYFVFRCLIRDRNDVYRILKTCAFTTALLGACMSYEYLTHVNSFSYLAGHTIIPWVREGRVRAQGPFGISITAGAFGATLFPTFFVLWSNAKSKLWASIGFVGASAMALTSVSSTPVTGYLAGTLALCLWPIRKKMRWVRWSIVASIVSLAILMKAPVWFLLARVNISGGHAYDRAILVDETVRHLSDWWLLGTSNNASWGLYTWDACNQFVYEGLTGGIVTLFFFIIILYQGFSAIGRCRRREKRSQEAWFFWCLGAALFAHVIVFLGVDYFDQIETLWYMFLAMLSSATLYVSLAKVSVADRTDGQSLGVMPASNQPALAMHGSQPFGNPTSISMNVSLRGRS